MRGLYETLREYASLGVYPFQMPGHKRRDLGFGDPFSIDITEIEGFDNLHHAEGILKEAQERAAALAGSRESWFLVNGSTAGILSAVSACVKPGGKILMARNCHKAVYHAVYLRQLEPVYLYPCQEPEYGLNGGIDPEEAHRLLREHPETQAVIVTSPTYDGVVSDIQKLAGIAHRFGIPLIVDEAHGAHFGFHGYFPASAVGLGADLVIQSWHKTLPSLTQTAVLHRCNDFADRERVSRFLGIYQTSSPSYVFMAALDRCTELLSKKAWEMFSSYADLLEEFRQKAEQLSVFRIPGRELRGENGIFDYDRSKLVLHGGGRICGRELSERLRKRYRIELEMEAGGYGLALTSLCDTKEGFERLFRALKEIDSEIAGRLAKPEFTADFVTENETACPLFRAWDGKKQRVRLADSAGEVSGEFLYLYPPGIPLLTPGEVISPSLLEKVLEYKAQGLSLQGLEDYGAETIQVLIS